MILLYLCSYIQYSKEAFFPPGNNSDSVFSSFLPRFSSFYKMEIITLRELLTNCLRFILTFPLFVQIVNFETVK
jgi:hypothetical protein